MKQPKRLTRKHKVILSKHNMDVKDYLVSSDDGEGFVVVHRDDYSKEYCFIYTGIYNAKLIYSPDTEN